MIGVAPWSPAAAQGITEIIAITGSTAPDGNGTFSSFFTPVLNDAGQAAFLTVLTGTSGGTNDDRAIYLGAGGPLTQIAREKLGSPIGGPGLTNLDEPVLNDSGQVAFMAVQLPATGGQFTGVFRGSGGALTTIAREGNTAPDGNGVFFLFGSSRPALNASGQAAFAATLTGTSGGVNDNEGIFLGSGGAVTQIAREGQAAPDGNGDLFTFQSPALNASGQAAFAARLTGTSGGTSDDSGIFLGSGGTVTQIARGGQAAPDGNGVFSFFGNPALNASGQAAFFANFTGTSGGFNDKEGIFLGSGGTVTQIARGGQAAPDGNGEFLYLSDPALNASGQAAFAATLTGTSGGVNDNDGIFLGSGGAVTQIARGGQAAPDGNGELFYLSSPALNASGQVAFPAVLSGTTGGTSDDGAIFLANGIDILLVARAGATLAGSTIIVLSINPSTGASGDQRSGINNAGQVAYLATLASGDEAVVRFTIPDLHWTAPGSGLWTTAGNWTQSTEPNSFHDTFIDPATSLTVTAPTTNTIVASLTLGGGVGVATLQLTGTSAGELRALEASTIAARGVLQLTDGRTFAAPTLENIGIIRGDGVLAADLTVVVGGEIRVAASESLVVAGVNHMNQGRIDVIAGSLEFIGALTNDLGTGLITGRNATLRFNGGLSNSGALALSFGTSDLFGDVTNTPSGSIVVAGNSNATFYDDVTNGGTLNVAAGSTAVFFGALSGNGNLGGGEVQALGDLVPGTSAGLMQFGGDLTMGPLTKLEIELGGPTAGSEFDRLEVIGNVALAGMLKVSLIDGFMPALGDDFAVLSFGTRTGDFTSFNGLDVGGHLSLRRSFTSTALILTARPAVDGDINLDGTVDIFDVNAVSAAWGTAGPAGDANGDGTVDIFDVNLISANWGAGSPGGGAAVPEPTSLVLVGLAILGAAIRWRTCGSSALAAG